MTDKMTNLSGSEIAVIGMTGRFPGARNIAEFWQNLKNSIESISFISDEELKTLDIDPNWLNNPNYVRVKGGLLEDKDFFDASFFGYTPKEAEIMDPQVRIFHECAWNVLEDAGYDPGSYNGFIGLYAGAGTSIYWENLTILSGKCEDIGYFASSHLNNKDFLSTQIAYKLNLKGPCFIVQTACSTSLVAIHLACQGILNGECNMALAGGISISAQKNTGYIYQEGMINSPDGHCRAFDSEAKGTIGGEGVGVVLLKSLEDAIKDRDHIYAVIKGTAINNDGLRKPGYTAPSIEGQAEVIHMAHQVAEVEPESITYVEAHGTGTELGDPVEIEALKLAFNTDKKNFCAVGSVKTNIGHLDAAAGAAAFIKTALALKNKQIPPSLHFKEPNPKINFKDSPFFVNAQLAKWESIRYPRRAGVSSFGIGGTNAHIVLEEWSINEEQTLEKKGKLDREYQLLLLSARTSSALNQMTENLGQFLKTNREICLADAAYTLMLGRKNFECRRTLVCRDIDNAIAAFSTPDSREVHTFFAMEQEKNVIFMFPGLGSQYVNMGRELYEKEPLFKYEMDTCFEILKPLINYEIKDILYPVGESTESHEKINDFEVAQLVIFIFEYALARLIIKWGVKPDAMIGYSFGEYAAACISGVLSLADALTLIISRGKLIGKLPPGAMLSVPLPKEKLKLELNGPLSIAIDNGSSCIVAGPLEAIDALAEQLKKDRCMCIPLNSSHAIHSQMMTPILKAFAESVGKIKINKPQIPYISNLTGTWITFADAANPAYWAKHLGETVQFAHGIKELLKKESAVFVEVGPGRDLNALVGRYFDNSSNYQALNLVKSAEQEISDLYYLLNKIGQLWLYGYNFQWGDFYSYQTRSRISLPTYPFEKQHYWIEGDLLKMMKKGGWGQESSAIADFWTYLPLWKRSFQGKQNKNKIQSGSNCLIFLNDLPLGKKLLEKLLENHRHVIIVKIGDAFEETVSEIKPCIYTINPKEFSHYDFLLERLCKAGILPHNILHCWNLTTVTDTILTRESFDAAQYLGFYSLLYMVKAIEKQNLNDDIHISFLTNHLQEVTGAELLCPEKAPALGLLKSIPQEFPRLICRSIDIILPEPGSPQETSLVDLLVEEFTAKVEDVSTAFRDNQRWVQFFDPYHPGGSGKDPGRSRLRKRGVYLITGGLEDIGLIISEVLVKCVEARLILIGLPAFPSPDEWPQWLQTHDEFDSISLKIKKLQKLQEMGGDVLYLQADVAINEQMQYVVSQAEATFGKINGVVHAAGITESNSMQLINRLSAEDCLLQFHSKVYGTMVLEQLFGNEKLDFFCFLSSISCILGGLGFGAYAGSNLFMDIFAKKYNRLNSANYSWFSLNWDNMDPGKSADLFERIFTSDGIDQLVVSGNGNIQQRIDQWINLESLRGKMNLNSDKKYSQTFKARPNLMNPYVEPHNHIEKNIIQIWQRIFGFEQIGIEDNFFELGGDSLKAIMLIARIHKELNIKISLPELFNTPTIKKLAEMIEKLGQLPQSNYIAIEPSEKKEYYPLSSAQKRLYILHQMDDQSTGYNVPFYFLLSGELNKDKFENAFKRLILRHDILKTSFHIINNEPMQRIGDDIQFEIEIAGINETCSNSNSSQPDIIRNFVRPFDLTKAPLLRAGLRKMTEEKHLLMVDMHHIVSDAVSINIVVNNFMMFYQGENLPQLRIQYKDFSEWCFSQKQKESLKQQKEFWLNEFAGEIPVLELPIDYLRPAVQSFEGNSINFEIEPGTTRALKALKLETGETLFMVLLAIYTIFLTKITNQEDIVVGSPSVGRRHADLEQVLGIFVNTLALRNYPNGEKTFTIFLDETKEKLLKAFENQDYPYEDLVEQVVFNRDAGRNPLFDTMFVLETTDIQKLEIPGLTLSPYPYENKTSKFDLTLTAIEQEDKLLFIFEYCTKLFKAETIERFSNYFKNIVSNIIKNKDGKISTFEILEESEKNRILFEFNNTGAGYPKDKNIHGLFTEQALKTPDRVAVVGADLCVCPYVETLRATSLQIQMSYHQLNDQSNRLAGMLIEKGVQSDAIVGIMMERSVEMIIGIFGILKSGGAYLPIDPNYPQERINYMLKDSAAAILLTDYEREQRVNYQLSIVNNQLSISGCPRRGPHHSAFVTQRIQHSDTHHLAYVIYTSGSTGKPKGVMIEHRFVVNLLLAMQNQYPFTPADTYLLKTSYIFDVSVTELFGWYIGGGKLAILETNGEKDPSVIFDWIHWHQVTHINFVPSMFNAFLDFVNEENKGRLASLKYIFLAGEALLPSRVKKFKDLNISIPLENLYGPTEGTVYSSGYSLSKWNGVDNVPIGKPIANIKLYILNKYNQLQPLGIPGELYISGEGVARGYLNRPELTAEKFQFNRSYKSYKTPILYKSGDLARWLPNGDIEFLGRRDHQVKINGIRIELTEIESILLQHAEIDEAVVILKEKSPGNILLCVYLVSKKHLLESEIRAYLYDKFPSYMIPAQFKQLEKIPLTPSGKVNRKLLASMEISTKETYLAPRNDIERKLKEIWEKNLGSENIGIRDNFFSIGGDSIKSIGLVNQLNQEFATNLKIRDLFQNETIEKLAKKIGKPDTGTPISTAQYDQVLQELDTLKNKFMKRNMN